MSTPAVLPIDLPEAQREKKQRRARAGERRGRGRVTSFNMQPEDELVLDTLRELYGTHLAGEAIRRAMREAVAARGVDIKDVAREATAA